jgi:hypothetical protein
MQFAEPPFFALLSHLGLLRVPGLAASVSAPSTSVGSSSISSSISQQAPAFVVSAVLLQTDSPAPRLPPPQRTAESPKLAVTAKSDLPDA